MKITRREYAKEQNVEAEKSSRLEWQKRLRNLLQRAAKFITEICLKA